METINNQKNTTVPIQSHESNNPDPKLLTQAAVISYLVIWAIAYLWISLREGEFFPSQYIWGTSPWLWQIGIGICFAVFFIGISLVAHCTWEIIRKGEYDLKQLLGNLNDLQIWILAAFSSIGEEFFFRGALQPCLGIWLTNLLFGIVHIPPTPNLYYYPVVAAVIGCGFGWLFVITGGGLIAPIVAHFVINLVGIYRINRLKREVEPVYSA